MACDTYIEWCATRMLTVSLTKTELMFSSNQHVTPPNVSIDVNGYLVTPKAYVKYLGLHLTRKLNWNYHIMTKCNKIKETVFAINRYTRLNWGLDQRILITLYKSIVEPIIAYGSAIWFPATRLKLTIQ